MKQTKDEFGTRDIISCNSAATIPHLFALRVEKTPEGSAYMQYDHAAGKWRTHTWRQMHERMLGYAEKFAELDLEPGDRVAVYLENSPEWVLFDIAAMQLGLVVVPLYVMDNVENIAYVLGDSGCKLLFLRDEESWDKLLGLCPTFPDLRYVLFLESKGSGEKMEGITYLRAEEIISGPRVSGHLGITEMSPDTPATIVYTSGTTGRPKGVVLSHHNILANADGVLQIIPAYPEDLFLSFLPLSHTFERTAGYYIPMMAGSTVAYVRSIPDLAEDIRTLHPTILIAVPRIYEKIYVKIMDRLENKGELSKLLFKWTLKVGKQRFEARRDKHNLSFSHKIAWLILKQLVASKILKSFGGKLRLSVSGGAPLGVRVSEFLLSLGVPLMQGYGLTETSPVVSVNSLEDNVPASVGRPLPGVEVRVDDQGELLVKGPNVMLGYWNRDEETREVLSADGWLKTGDLVFMEQGRIYIRGRLKDVLVTSTGEKVSPSDLETAILQDPLFQQAIVVGDGKPYITAVVVLNFIAWKALAEQLDLDPGELGSLRHPVAKQEALARCERQTSSFPSYARVRDICLTLLPWTIENGLITPTLKTKRREVQKRLAQQISDLYSGHHLP